MDGQKRKEKSVMFRKDLFLTWKKEAIFGFEKTWHNWLQNCTEGKRVRDSVVRRGLFDNLKNRKDIWGLKKMFTFAHRDRLFHLDDTNF